MKFVRRKLLHLFCVAGQLRDRDERGAAAAMLPQDRLAESQFIRCGWPGAMVKGGDP